MMMSKETQFDEIELSDCNMKGGITVTTYTVTIPLSLPFWSSPYSCRVKTVAAEKMMPMFMMTSYNHSMET